MFIHYELSFTGKGEAGDGGKRDFLLSPCQEERGCQAGSQAQFLFLPWTWGAASWDRVDQLQPPFNSITFHPRVNGTFTQRSQLDILWTHWFLSIWGYEEKWRDEHIPYFTTRAFLLQLLSLLSTRRVKMKWWKNRRNLSFCRISWANSGRETLRMGSTIWFEVSVMNRF